jgi:cytochrome P450
MKLLTIDRSLMIPMVNMEDFVAPLQLLSTSSYCRARQWRLKLLVVMNSLLEHVEPQGSSSTECFGRTILQMEKEGEIDDFEKCSLAMVWIVAAHASFPGLFASFVSSISWRPEVQQCARQELSSNIETHGLPPSDERKLPYCRAVLLEAMRCNGASIDSPHLVTEGMTLGGHVIPAGTALVLDKWTINHDEARFQDPMLFEVSKPVAWHLTRTYIKSP